MSQLPLCLSPAGASVVAQLVWQEHPHGDELTFIHVCITGPGIDASATIESIAGDAGNRFEPGEDEAGLGESIALHEYLRELSAARSPWTGERGWRSFDRALRFQASCDTRGHVELGISIRFARLRPEWFATAVVEHPLGDLARLADDVEAWFHA